MYARLLTPGQAALASAYTRSGSSRLQYQFPSGSDTGATCLRAVPSPQNAGHVHPRGPMDAADESQRCCQQSRADRKPDKGANSPIRHRSNCGKPPSHGLHNEAICRPLHANGTSRGGGVPMHGTARRSMSCSDARSRYVSQRAVRYRSRMRLSGRRASATAHMLKTAALRREFQQVGFALSLLRSSTRMQAISNDSSIPDSISAPAAPRVTPGASSRRRPAGARLLN
jgi:hypothetical protein